MLFSFLPVSDIIYELINIPVFYKNMDPQDYVIAPIVFSLANIISNILLPIYIVWISSLVISLIAIWRLNFLNESRKRKIGAILNSIYALAFFTAITLWAYNLLKGRNLNQLPYLSLLLPLTYIESIWRFNKKSINRRYFNGLNFIYGSFFWILAMQGVNDDYWIGLILIKGLIFYIISLIIAAVEQFSRARELRDVVR